jgi:nucleotide-binding universal stress UspA family protein
MTMIQPRRPYEHVVVPIDDSDLSHRAVDEGRLLAQALGGQLHLLHAEPHWDRRETGIHREAERLAAELGAVAAVRSRGVDDIPVATVIDRYVSEVGNGVVCMASHGRRGVAAGLFGSTTEQLVRESGRAVVVIGPSAPAHAETFERVVAGYDGSRFAEAALGEAAGWAKALGVPLWVVESFDPNAPSPMPAESPGSRDVMESAPVHREADLLAGSGIDVEWETLHDRNPAEALVNFASTKPGTLTVVATHGRTGLSRLVAGSVASGVVRRATGPVVVVRPAGV